MIESGKERSNTSTDLYLAQAKSLVSVLDWSWPCLWLHRPRLDWSWLRLWLVPAKTWPKKKVNAAPASDDDKGMCSDVLLQVHEALKTIREHKVFDKIEETKPLTIAQGGQQAVFDAAQCTKALSQENNKYKCSGNFFWQDLLWLANHRVPMNAGQINQNTEIWFATFRAAKVFSLRSHCSCRKALMK